MFQKELLTDFHSKKVIFNRKFSSILVRNGGFQGLVMGPEKQECVGSSPALNQFFMFAKVEERAKGWPFVFFGIMRLLTKYFLPKPPPRFSLERGRFASIEGVVCHPGVNVCYLVDLLDEAGDAGNDGDLESLAEELGLLGVDLAEARRVVLGSQKGQMSVHDVTPLRGRSEEVDDHVITLVALALEEVVLTVLTVHAVP